MDVVRTIYELNGLEHHFGEDGTENQSNREAFQVQLGSFKRLPSIAVKGAFRSLEKKSGEGEEE